jgi:hypothetical protein
MKRLCCLGALVTVMLAGVTHVRGQKEAGFVALFDGKSLDGWHIMNGGKFSVKGGVIVLDKGSGWLRSDKEYQDFELRMDFRFVSKGADSGIFVRAGKDGKNWPAKNYQVQTMDNDSIGGLFVSGFDKVKAKRDTAKLKEVRKKTEEWQTYAITVKGDAIEIKLNGQTVTTANSLSVQPGHIGLQGEGGQLEFKNVRIKVLK